MTMYACRFEFFKKGYATAKAIVMAEDDREAEEMFYQAYDYLRLNPREGFLSISEVKNNIWTYK